MIVGGVLTEPLFGRIAADALTCLTIGSVIEVIHVDLTLRSSAFRKAVNHHDHAEENAKNLKLSHQSGSRVFEICSVASGVWDISRVDIRRQCHIWGGINLL